MSNLHRRKRAATAPSQAPDWSSLAPDLIRSIGDNFLATGDIDCYVSLRAVSVCHPWRAATDDPCGPDQRFRPRGWDMLGSLDRKEQDSRRLFLNVNTGRFLWEDMPMLSNYVCLAADDTNGLLVLRAGREFVICVLNPFTGHMVSHDPSWASIATGTLKVAVHGAGSPLLYAWDSCLAVRNGKAFLTDPTAQQWRHSYTSTALVTFQGGCTYKVDEKRAVKVVEAQGRSGHLEMRLVQYRTLELQIEYTPLQAFLVDNAGEVLIVRLRTSGCYGAAQIFGIDLEDEALHAVTSVGNRAVLLGNRCLSVDACNLPDIESNCIYYIGGERSEARTICIYCLEDESHEKLFRSSPYGMSRHPALPLSLLEVLMDYPKQVESRFGSACQTWEYYYACSQLGLYPGFL